MIWTISKAFWRSAETVRVRLDLVTISNMETKFDIALADHPLFAELARYVALNRRARRV